MEGPRYDLIQQNNADAEAARLRYELRLSEEQYQAEAKHAIKLETAIRSVLEDFERRDEISAVDGLRAAISDGGESETLERNEHGPDH